MTLVSACLALAAALSAADTAGDCANFSVSDAQCGTKVGLSLSSDTEFRTGPTAGNIQRLPPTELRQSAELCKPAAFYQPALPPGIASPPGLPPAPTEATNALREPASPLPAGAPPVFAGPAPAAAPLEPETHADMVAGGDEFFTRSELLGELGKLTWSKGGFKITPYGWLWASMSYESQRSRITDYCLFVESPSLVEEAAFGVDAKSTRLGVDVVGPEICWFPEAQNGGKLEIDFQGRFLQRNKPDVLLRHAYWEVKNDEYRLLAGQTWDVISPLYLPILNYTAGSAVGNLGYRRAQLRAERYLALSDTALLTLQGALAVDILIEFINDPEVTADHGPYPDLQGRIGYTIGRRTGPDARPATVGVSAHIGESSYDFRAPLPDPIDDVARRTWSLNADLSVPIGKRAGIQGEFFTGENLAGYYAGILQGVDRVTRRTIRATGGWADFWFDPCPTWHWHAGYSIDDPFNQDLTSGRLYNHTIYTNLSYDVAKFLTMGLEVSVWRTGWVDLRPGQSTRLEFATRYKF
ncbi:MAG: hypothetical protein ACOY3P_18295 [Planctomycetota bacterium]